MPELHIACHAWAYNNLPLEEAIGTIARLGFRHMDLGSGPHLDVRHAAAHPQAEAERILALLAAFDLQIADLYLLLPHINAPDPARREAHVALFRRLIPFAVALGTPGITVTPGVLQPDGAAHSLARSVPALLRMVAAIEETGLRLSFEPHMDSVAQRPEQALLLLEAVPGLSVTLDYAHFAAQGIVRREILPLLEHVAHVHVRQARRGQLQTAHDLGTIDLIQLVEDLHHANYHGTLTVEYMTTFGWHGMQEISITRETVRTRDVLRIARANIQTHTDTP